ncbi:MAG: aminodeoxychorismate synthase, component I [Ferrovum sp. 37-45-19]|jgi:para-aminobenzoate synthetase/4-amino-4-deoxychorismate lyase|nr:MAG: aminodeoxychorismate synthase, component I [Ferrovum sp. 21-44-67]OYV95006.1 MAG: aminodeoxychorismate synthase, component I [Ferrovum sp. 37-45-19]OZB34248.1 MAG: aminodeoxychorismate synthase, component I [Ferrovum sp. 34-44-207]HQT80939.1 aminodeoxychorismate synthase component I [Ferrovaceae bacterium]HQU06941.1 aminodeoxychorismate synthase component I [Ferrovaceae bacterium]
MPNDILLNITLDFPINKNSVQRLFFTQPKKIIQATQESDIQHCLLTIEQEQLKGNFVVGFLSYDNALTDYLLLFGVYSAPLLIKPWSNSFQSFQVDPWRLSEGIDKYTDKINTIKKHIKNGDCYQLNYTIRAESRLLQGHTFDLFEHLTDCQAASYSAYIEHQDFTILSFSPELFFFQQGTHIHTKPMKGTKPFHPDDSLEKQKKSLEESVKDQSENLMIVDLLRNDLSKISRKGSVKTSELFAVESYLDILQMTSTISGKLEPHITFKDTINALFPCGSITGAPKKKVMEIIKRMEDQPRGPYCGAIGYLAPEQKNVFNVAIRTIVHNKKNNQLTYGVGSGVTWDSEPLDEYQEIRNKINFLSQEKPYSLFETVYLHHGKCFFWNQHFARLRQSAQYLNFVLPDEDHYNSINLLYPTIADSSFRGKFIYHRNGTARWELYPLPTEFELGIVNFASTSISSNDFRINHKTTDRSIYDQQFSKENLHLFDIILCNERDEVTEFTKGNIVVELDKLLYTPPQTSGLLPGVLRKYLLENNIIHERILHREEVINASNIWLINSLRGWVKVKLDLN